MGEAGVKNGTLADCKNEKDVIKSLSVNEEVGKDEGMKSSCSSSLEDSRESSPSSFTKRESSPTTNGILTPPIEENDVHSSSCSEESGSKKVKHQKAGGRLKFFKGTDKDYSLYTIVLRVVNLKYILLSMFD